ncbi:hypothetical protein LTR85_008925 [Meristemomyces frigidus]|nr:hypothetical protein LTR85_008925 [Meristemomyces frigidus]
MAKRKATSEGRAAGDEEIEDMQHKGQKMTPQTMPKLLGIPPELRNHIYRYAPTDSDLIQVNARNATRPDLLLTCRQLRQEASGIFFGENAFHVLVMDLKWPVPKDQWRDDEGATR